MCAVANDEEIAASMPPPKLGPPPLHEWDPVVELLTLLADEVRQLTALTMAANSKTGKVKPPKPLPRPRTAYDRVKSRKRWEVAASIRQQLDAARGGPTMSDGRPDPHNQL